MVKFTSLFALTAVVTQVAATPVAHHSAHLAVRSALPEPAVVEVPVDIFTRSTSPISVIAKLITDFTANSVQVVLSTKNSDKHVFSVALANLLSTTASDLEAVDQSLQEWGPTKGIIRELHEVMVESSITQVLSAVNKLLNDLITILRDPNTPNKTEIATALEDFLKVLGLLISTLSTINFKATLKDFLEGYISSLSSKIPAELLN